MIMKRIATWSDKEKVLSLAKGKTYIDVNADNYDVFVIESNEINVFFLLYVGGPSMLTLLEKYDFNNNTVAYFGKCLMLNKEFSDLMKNMGCNDVFKLDPVQICEVTYSILEKERTYELNNFNKEMENLFEIVYPMSENKKTVGNLLKYNEIKTDFVKSQRHIKADRLIVI